MTDRAVSEALGYVMVFGLITVTIGTVYASGITGLYDAQQAEQTENVVRAFDVLADNLQAIHRRGATSRATEVKLAGGTLGFGETVRFTVDVEDDDDPNVNDSFTMNPQPIVYEHDSGTEVVYVGTGVIRTDAGGSAMRADPEFRYDDDFAVIPFIVTYHSDGPRSIGGATTVLVVGRLDGAGLAGDAEHGLADFDPDGDARVNVTVDSPRADAWASYFEGEGYTAIDGDASDDVVTYQFTTDRVFVPQTEIQLRLRP